MDLSPCANHQAWGHTGLEGQYSMVGTAAVLAISRWTAFKTLDSESLIQRGFLQ